MADTDEKRAKKTTKRYVLISAVAERLQVHPQTIRMYEREGLIKPTRSAGNTRLYDDRSIGRLETILNLTRELGVNLAGVEVILNMKERMDRLEAELEQLAETTRQLSADRRAGVDRRHALIRVKSGLPVKR
jgi:MerR family transcriptional regulator/heat shock protein HspR